VSREKLNLYWSLLFVATQPKSLRASLQYEPQELKFGTSGRRGRVADIAQLEVYLNALAELEYLQSLPRAEGGIVRGEEFFLAYDLRPSSTSLVPEMGGRGEIAQAVVAAIEAAGMRAVNLGRIPTPALACYALSRGRGSMMVTGSHIPFDRNGYKTYSSRGELLKEQEGPIGEQAAQVRDRLYSQPAARSPFDEHGFLKIRQALPPEQDGAQAEYVERYTKFFAGASGVSLEGKRVLFYQHSAVGRDLLARILERLGAQVIRAGRSDTFVPVDTENIDAAQLAAIQSLADEAAKEGALDAVVSIDGDSDRPLILGVEPSGRVRFFGGDLVGMVAAEFLKAGAVVVPVSCNDAIDRSELAGVLEPKTRIGSPYVIAGIEAAIQCGKRGVCGWEANGGFLTGSEFARNGAVLSPLPTRDAALPILSVLFAAKEGGLPLVDLFGQLPARFSRAALLKQFPRSVALEILARLSPQSAEEAEIEDKRGRLAEFFPSARGFGKIINIDTTDGMRIRFDNGDVAHVRPSGNADELRIYAVADTQARADVIAAMGVAEPDGILRRMEKALRRG
jgi:phosphomannomutase